MNAAAWTQHIRESGAVTNQDALDILKEHLQADCPICTARRATRRANAQAKTRAAAYRDCGMTRTPYGWE
jgi:hypothetical protein